MHEMYRTLCQERWLCIKKRKISRPLISLSCNSQAHILPEALLLGMGVLSHSVMSDSVWPHGMQPVRLLCHEDSPGRKTGVDCHFFLQGMDLLDPGIEPASPVSPALQEDSLPTEPPGKALLLGMFWHDFPESQGHSYIVLPSYSLPSPLKMVTYFYQLSVWQIHYFSLAFDLTVPYQVFCVSFLYRYYLPRFKVWG